MTMNLEPLESAVSAPTGPKGLKVLVVEDNADGAETMAAVVRTAGHTVNIASNGLAGIVMAEKDEPDVVLLDIGLPFFNGFEVARSLRDKCKRKPIIVAVTGYGEQAVRERAVESGFDYFFVKPVDLGMLTKLLARLSNDETTGNPKG
jgi:CheY-like chemotaxis protein